MSRFRGLFGSAQAIVLVLVVLIGGLWYLYSNKIFPFDNLGHPRADISHEIFSACLDADRRWLRAIVDIQNVGTVRFKLGSSDHYLSQVAPAGNYAFPDGASTGSIHWPLLAHSPPNENDQRSKRHPEHSRDNEFSMRPSTRLALGPGESHKQYQDFVIRPEIRVVEVTSAFVNPSRSTDNGIVSWEARTIYDVGSASCAQ